MADDRKPCGMPAMFRYTWPGKEEAFVCMAHAQMLRNVANAIGLPLQIIPLSIDEMGEEKNCTNESGLPKGPD